MKSEKEYQCEVWDIGNTKCLIKSQWFDTLREAEKYGNRTTEAYALALIDVQFWIQIRFKEEEIQKTTIEKAMEQMNPLGKALTERLISKYASTPQEGFPSKEKSNMEDKFITLDGQRYRLTPVDSESTETGIASLKAGMKKIDLVAEVALDWKLNVFIRKTDGSEGRVHSLLVKDETGSIKVALWNTHAETVKDIQEGDTIAITNGYVKLGQKKDDVQYIELHVGKLSTVEIVQEEQHVL